MQQALLADIQGGPKIAHVLCLNFSSINRQNQKKICTATITRNPTTSQVRRYFVKCQRLKSNNCKLDDFL